jgi:glycosyltransferase involved in cell wall biosynthesis
VKYLFVHQNFPGQFIHLVRHLAASKRHELVFITEPNPNQIAGVRKLPYRRPTPGVAGVHPGAQELDTALRRAEFVAYAALNLKRLGFTPDIIIGHHGWGELLNLADVWPGVPLLGYFEFFYQTKGIDVGFDPEFPIPASEFPRIRAKNAINHLALDLSVRNNAIHGQTPTKWQLSTYPDWAHPHISLLREGVDLTLCAPKQPGRITTKSPSGHKPFKIGDTVVAPQEKLVTYVARDLEPYRGFHILMRALPHLLRERPDLRVVIVGGDGVSYGAAPRQGTWRETLLAELGSQIDPNRVSFVGRVDYGSYLGLLQRSDAHVYLTYPFVTSWSLREALACGCAVIGSDTQPVREFIRHRGNGVLAPFFDPPALARKVLEVLEDAALAAKLRTAARQYAERHLSMETYLSGYEALIARLVENQTA